MAIRVYDKDIWVSIQRSSAFWIRKTRKKIEMTESHGNTTEVNDSPPQFLPFSLTILFYRRDLFSFVFGSFSVNCTSNDFHLLPKHYRIPVPQISGLELKRQCYSILYEVCQRKCILVIQI